MAKSVQKNYGIRLVVVVRGFGSKDSNERKNAGKYLKRARKLGYASITSRFQNDTDFRHRMVDEGKNLDDVERLDDLARTPVEIVPMTYGERVKAGLTVSKTIEEGAQTAGGGSDTVRGQKRWNERQWQEWNAWHQSRGWTWRT